MKLIRLLPLTAALMIAPLASWAADTEPGRVDFGKILPAGQGQYVEIDLDQGLLKLAAAFANEQEKEAAQVLRGLKHVRVHVITLDDSNRATAVQKITEVREKLSAEGWKRIVTVKQNQAEDVAIFARVRGEEAIEGLAVTVLDGDRQAVLVNITGDVKPEQIAALGARFNIDPLKHVAVAKN